MAEIKTDDHTLHVDDGEPIKEACMDLDVPFGCENGLCGTCIIEVIDGYENLSKLNQAEIDMELEPNQRLGCQCSIKSGTVKIKF